ncbi:gliding motility protein [Pigmentiphaga aceris]|uniref:Gliding motility protein n=1 Tax=Pigmentiphaga aceris TaxID=1940612 RepID=A0A5C0B3A5_9BURK|nr:gliding motility protein [Pigmentiphaga aceris]QEI07680.1 gliding motility protein [Pigmentiphaga aceris]
MTPTPGDIFAFYNARLNAYTAIQVTHVETDKKPAKVAVLTLDWRGKTLPSDAEIAVMQPKVFDFFFWNARFVHRWVSLPVPPGFTHVGHKPSLHDAEVNSYSGWPTGSSFYSQQQWDARPKAQRDRFKEAAATRDKTPLLTLGDVSVNLSTQRLDGERLAMAGDLSVFDALPLLTNVTTDRPIAGLFDFLRKHAFVYEAELCNHGEARVDLRGTYLTRLSLDVTGVTELFLNDDLEHLSLLGTPSSDLRIHANADGRWLTVMLIDPDVPWQGLDALGALNVRQGRDVDVAKIVTRFPALSELRIWGAPGYVRNLPSLAALSGLQTWTFYDVFGFGPEDIPASSNFPMLGMFWTHSIPADAAAAIKKAYKAATANGLDLAVRQPRKPEWLAANLDNPFRDWDGTEGITAAQAKKGAALYKTARADALKVAGEADSLAALGPIVRTYIEAFNKLDARNNFIFTEEREQICMAWQQIVDAVDEKRRELDAGPVDRTALDELMDSIRDF